MKLKIAEFYTLQGRIGPLKFIAGITVVLVIAAMLYLVGMYSGLVDFDSYRGRIFAALPALFLMVAAVPFFVKRLHDLNTHGGWAATFLVCLVFSLTNIWAAIYFCLGLLILLFKRGNPDENAWGKPNKQV